MPNKLKSEGKVRHPLPSQLIHDLRTPLNQIVGYSEMLSEQAREGGQNAFLSDLDKVHGAGLRLLQIINDNFDSVATTSEHVGTTVTHSPPMPVGREALGQEAIKGIAQLLIVDDEEGNRDVLERLLQKQGYEVSKAQNGQSALDMLNQQSYDLVLLDIMMPQIDGYEVLRHIKLDEQLRHIPVIMISALSELESVARCISLGADDYLTKPFNSTLLKARISASLKKKRSHDREQLLFEQLQENYERLKELEGHRDDLTHMIIHDLRTPLTSVSAAIQTMELVGEVNPDQHEIIEIAITGANELLATINSLLDVEKLESGAMDLDYVLLSLPIVIASAVAQVAPLAEAKGLNFVQEVSIDLPWLRADENKLQRVLVNLFGNAIKFTPSGGTVTLHARMSEENQWVEFAVEDTGEGIPAEEFERVFEKFGQVDAAQNGHTLGTGLGLTFCKLAVEAHGGHIELKSTPGVGSTFSFTIPLESPKAITVNQNIA